MDARVLLQGIEIGEVAQVAQEDDGDIDLALPCFHRLGGQRHGVFFLDDNVFIIGYHAQHGDAAQVFHHLHARLEQPQVAPELVHEDAFHQPPFFRPEQGQRAIYAGKHASPVNVAYQENIRPGMECHRQVHQVGIPQVDFRDAARAFQHDRIIACRQTVVGGANLPAQFFASFPAEIFVGTAVSDGPSVQHHLRRMVGLGLQQQRIHVRVAGDARRLGLHRLRPSDFQSFRCGERVERHVLRLERCGSISVLPEDAAEGRGEDALAHIAPRAHQHHGVKTSECHFFFHSTNSIC